MEDRGALYDSAQILLAFLVLQRCCASFRGVWLRNPGPTSDAFKRVDCLRLFPGARCRREHFGRSQRDGLDRRSMPPGVWSSGIMSTRTESRSVGHHVFTTRSAHHRQGYDHSRCLSGTRWIGADSLGCRVHTLRWRLVSAGWVGAKPSELIPWCRESSARIGSRNTPSNTEEPVAVTSG